MLNQISISNFAIVDQLDLDIDPGMTVITGETGAGKSIMLDALGLSLGDRADSNCVRNGKDRADIRACFDLSHNPEALQWLRERDYDNDSECILRRVITKEGRSRGYINGTPTPLSDLKSIGEFLIDIHGQHEHQSLLKKATHHLLLNQYSGTNVLAKTVARLAHQHNQTSNDIESLLSQRQERDERIQLLSYQLHELDQLNLQEGEVAELERELKQLSQAGATLSACHQVNQVCSDDEAGNLLQQLSTSIHLLSDLQIDSKAINNTLEMLSTAQIQVEEAVGELHHFIDHFDADPEKMHLMQERLGAIYELARKHRIQPEQLLEKQQQISDDLEKIQCHDEQLVELETTLELLKKQHQEASEKLSKKRTRAARKLEKIISERISLLGMPKGQVKIALTEINRRTVSPSGFEDIEFLVTTNPGQPPRPLAKVASGGELSRISLAIQVIIAQTAHTPTMVFDEVDVGIGGGTAEIVGNMLRELGGSGQVLCVTHQPQVASQGHHHLYVNKKVSNASSNTRIHALSDQSRTREIARMLGGIEITESTLTHAQEMLDSVTR